ncbi:MAG: hypothetical protein FJ030_06370 [Chloroflexi bacterium]|nr:hypothetical protein [Chloroflexota bacterium]
MTKRFLILLAIVSIALAGCGLAAADTQATVIAQVNATVAAMPPEQVPVTVPVIMTQEVPVQVPVTVVVQVTVPVPAAPTNPPAAAPTTAPVTSNVGPDPLAGANVTPIIDERFDFPNKYYWWLFGPEVSSSGEGMIEDEVYVMISHQTENYEWTFDGKKLTNFYVSAETVMPDGQCKIGDHWGLIFRYKDNANFYMFGVSCDGTYTLMKRQDGIFETVLQPTLSPAIKKLGQTNVIGVRAVSNQLSFYANDRFLITVADNTFSEGLIGMYVRALLTPDLTVHFDDITAYIVNQ